MALSWEQAPDIGWHGIDEEISQRWNCARPEAPCRPTHGRLDDAQVFLADGVAVGDVTWWLTDGWSSSAGCGSDEMDQSFLRDHANLIPRSAVGAHKTEKGASSTGHTCSTLSSGKNSTMSTKVLWVTCSCCSS